MPEKEAKENTIEQLPGIITQWGVWTTGQVSEILDLPRRKLILYVEQQLLVPSIQSKGKGRPRGFMVADLFKISVIRVLEGFGVSPRTIREFLDSLPPVPIRITIPEGQLQYPKFLVLYRDCNDKLKPVYTDDTERFIGGGHLGFMVVNCGALMRDILEKIGWFWERQ